MISAWGITDKGVVRKQNQDDLRFAITGEDSAWGVVCDGMGGAKAGDIASRMAADVFEHYMKARIEEQPAEDVLRLAAEAANEIVYLKASSNPDYNGMGTTLVGSILQGDDIWVVNIGDSRAYYSTAGTIRRVTRDHSVVEDLVEKGDITPEEARQHPQKNLITRALGTGKQVQADLYSLTGTEGDFLLLCSDGLINEVSDEEILSILRSGRSLEVCCRNLLELALVRGAPDNVTVVLFQL